jgi:HK97 family phage major capsid protein
MARETFEAWIPEEFGSEVITRIQQNSVVEAVASRIPMASNSRSTPRSAGMDVDVVDKGGAYGEDSNTNDDVVLTAKKFGKAIRIAEEDIDDSLADIIKVKMTDWSTSYAKILDNASFGVTGAPGTGVPFKSVYYLLSQTDSGLGYTGGSNITQCGTGGITYDVLSNGLSKVESGDYFDPSELIAVAHPSFRAKLRNVKDLQGEPIFVEGLAGTPPTIFGHQVKWSLGARTSATASSRPGGNPLILFVHPSLMLLGVRSGPESIFIDGKDGTSALTDESLLKMRSRRGFAYGHPAGACIVENNSGS